MTKKGWMAWSAVLVLFAVLLTLATGTAVWAAPGAQGTVSGAQGGPIGSAGGTVPAGNVTVTVPAGVVPDGTRLSVFPASPGTPPQTGGFLVGGSVVQITMTGPSDRAYTQFATPVTICFTLDPGQIAASGGATGVKIQWYNTATGKWEDQATQQTPGTNQFCTSVNHLSIFGVFTAASAPVVAAQVEGPNLGGLTPWALVLGSAIVLGILWTRRPRK
jgi:hypothetical protein